MDPKQKIADLEAELAKVRENDELSAIERSREVLRLTGEIKAAKIELDEIEAADAALAELDAAKADADKGDKDKGGDKDGAGKDGEDDKGDDAPGTPKPNPHPVKKGEEAPVALAASAGEHDAKPDEDKDDEPGFTLTAAASIGGVQAGGNMQREHVLDMLQYASRAKDGRTRMFEMNRFAEGTPVIHASNSPIENSRIMRETRKADQQPLALSAAACFCGPDEIRSDFDVIGRRGRPVAGIFASGAIGTAGFTYYPDIAINPDSGSVNLWDCTDQAGVDPADDTTWKQCSELDCFTPEDALGYMITACTIVQRTHQWAHPEQVNVWLDKLRLEYDRLAETALLNIIDDAAGTPLTVGASGGGLATHGIVSQMVYALGNLDGPLGYEFRDSGLEGQVLLAPRGFTKAALADEKLRGFPNNIRTEADLITYMYTSFGVRLVERLDEANRDSLPAARAATVTAMNAGGAIDAQGSEPAKTPLRPAFSRFYLIDPTQWFHAEGQMVAADWHVDTALLRQNRMLYFWENVELLVQTGLRKPLILDIYGPVNGARSDLATPPA